jgi:hypothetical protein
MQVDDRSRRTAGIGAGDTATLELELTKDWPEPVVPEDLAPAVATGPQTIQQL